MNLIIFPLSLISLFHDDSVNPIGLTELRRQPLNMMCVFLFLDPDTQDCFFLCWETCCADSPGCSGPCATAVQHTALWVSLARGAARMHCVVTPSPGV